MTAATAAQGTAASNARRSGPALLLAGGGTALAVTALAVAAPDIATAGRPAYLASGAVMSLVDLAVAVGLAMVAVSAPLRLGRARGAVVWLTVGASLAMVVAEVLLRADFALGNVVYGVVGPLQALGLISLGMGIARARAWTSWRRWAFLAWGLYVPLVMVPLLAASGGTSLLALAGYHVGVVAAGLAARAELGRAG